MARTGAARDTGKPSSPAKAAKLLSAGITVGRTAIWRRISVSV
jgi:hypothetical protein